MLKLILPYVLSGGFGYAVKAFLHKEKLAAEAEVAKLEAKVAVIRAHVAVVAAKAESDFKAEYSKVVEMIHSIY